MAELTHSEPSFSFGRTHMHAGAVAAVISVMIHIALGLVASHVNLELIALPHAKRPPREYEAVQLGSVEVDPDVQDQVLTALQDARGEVAPQAEAVVEELQIAPEEGVTEPPAADEVDLKGEIAAIAEPTSPPVEDVTVPRQEILAIENVAVGDVPAGLERRVVPEVTRVPNAPDLVLPSTRDGLEAVSAPAQTEAEAPTVSEIVEKVKRSHAEPAEAVVKPEAVVAATAPGGSKELFEETAEEVTGVEPIEQVLTANIETYVPPRDAEYGYFRLEVERAGEALLPVIPKDIILVQDSSASMAEQRLYFCRKGLHRALAHIRPVDRFNIAKFSEQSVFCFNEWVAKTPETLARAEAFINNMQARGYTDIFASMQDLLEFKRRPGRPVVALVITDGLANKGLTDSTEIVGEFSRVNDGHISVFTMGTFKQANRYLIDLLSFCNQGGVHVVTSGRWDIPDDTEKMMQGIRRPVLSDLRLQIASGSSCEMYPRQIGNLYLDQPLVLYGRYRRGESSLVFQAIGQAEDRKCDLIMHVPLEGEAIAVDDNRIRHHWAQQKIYHLIGKYARRRDPEILLQLRRTARAYDQPIPYKRRLF